MIHKIRGDLTSETLEQKLRLRDKVKLKAQLLPLDVYIYSPGTVLLIIHSAAE
jgi:hypothetical protein